MVFYVYPDIYRFCCSSFIPEVPSFPLVSFFCIISCRPGLLLTNSHHFVIWKCILFSVLNVIFADWNSGWLLKSRCSTVFWPPYFWWEICGICILFLLWVMCIFLSLLSTYYLALNNGLWGISVRIFLSLSN